MEIEELRNGLRTLLTAPSIAPWTLGWGPSNITTASTGQTPYPLTTQLTLGSHFMVLKMKMKERISFKGGNGGDLTGFQDVIVRDLGSLSQGTPLMAHGCPFGALVGLKFHNFVTTGVLSAMVNTPKASRNATPVVALGDFNCLPGMEGAIVTTTAESSPYSIDLSISSYSTTTARNSTGCEGSFPPAVVGMLCCYLRAPQAHAEISVIVSMRTLMSTLKDLPESINNSGVVAISHPLRDGKLISNTLLRDESSPPQRNLSKGRHSDSSNTKTNNNSAGHRLTTRQLSSPTAAATAGPLQLLQRALRAVVAIDPGGGWASGVLVSSTGHVITNAHALPNHTHGPQIDYSEPSITPIQPSTCTSASTIASIHCQMIEKGLIAKETAEMPRKANNKSPVKVLVQGKWLFAEVVFIFSPPLDLAILKLCLPEESSGSAASQLPEPIELSTDQSPVLRPGGPVVVAGFPLWRPKADHSFIAGLSGGPLVTFGNAALVVPQPPAAPAVLVTTAAVHAGASGGAVLDPGTGQLVGLVTSNTKLGLKEHSTENQGRKFPPRQHRDTIRSTVLYPHLNYCIGTAALRPVVAALKLSSLGSPTDWVEVEARLRRDGVMEAWRSMRSMEGPPKQSQGQRGLPPALSALVERVDGGGGGRGPNKLSKL